MDKYEEALKEIRLFIHSIEGHGYGGTSEYEGLRPLIDLLDKAREKARKFDQLVDNAPQWMPIETAPRDGTKCLFLTAEPEQGSPAYNMKEGRIFSGKWSDHDFILEGAYTRKPTHWMPLPRGPHD